MAGRTSVWIFPDQLLADHPALRLAERDRGEVRVVLVESRSWLRRLPYHRIRQTLILSAGRHYAAELADRGYEVEVVAAESSRAGLVEHLARHRPDRMVTMLAAEHAPRRWQVGAMADDLGVPVEVVPNTQFLVGRFDPIPDPEPGRRYVLEDFYHAIRRRFNLLMGPGDEPESGRWNFDLDNRRRLPRRAAIPPPGVVRARRDHPRGDR